MDQEKELGNKKKKKMEVGASQYISYNVGKIILHERRNRKLTPQLQKRESQHFHYASSQPGISNNP